MEIDRGCCWRHDVYEWGCVTHVYAWGMDAFVCAGASVQPVNDFVCACSEFYNHGS